MESLNCLSVDSIKLIRRNQLLLSLVRGELIYLTIKDVYLEPKIKDSQIEAYRETLGISDEEKKDQWLKQNDLDWLSFEDLALEEMRIKEYSRINFDDKVESHFLKRKNELDIVIYSLIRTSDPFLAQELYQRALNNEEDFGTLATQYSEGIEKKTRGIIGPIPIQQSHPLLAEFLKSTTPGKISPPIQINNYHLVVRLESYDPVKLDDHMREKMSLELFKMWVNKKAVDLMQELLDKTKETKTLDE